MESIVSDVLSASVVFVGITLMDKPDAQRNLAEVMRSDVVQVETGISINPVGGVPNRPELAHRYALDRDRIYVETSPARSSVTKEYVSQTAPFEDFARLAQVVTCARDNTRLQSQQLRAYGYNMTVVFGPDWTQSASAYLGEHLFASHQLVPATWEAIGGLGTLYFWDGSRRWTFNIEPRPRDDHQSSSFFLSINVHIESDDFPETDAITQAFNDVLNESSAFVGRLLDRGA